ncbi:unnamed protein product [Cylindrotheca closterium]|uniref:Potassium channel domain-containing protein n=1 Tax=Cylindrotheca closterium TaxID=2856 RepID=A0AAD2FUX3_9STRA|nr:unnamed protein product [Cylindrotheca closterium]
MKSAKTADSSDAAETLADAKITQEVKSKRKHLSETADTLGDAKIVHNRKSKSKHSSEAAGTVPVDDAPGADALHSTIPRNISIGTQNSKDRATPLNNIRQLPPTGQPTKKIGLPTKPSSLRLSLVADVAENATKRIGSSLVNSEQQLARVAEQKAKQITDVTTKQIGSAIKQSERVYKKSRWCFWARFIGRFPKYFPRVFYFTFGVLVPLWLLILISAGFGIILADYEAAEERISNHDILASRARTNRISVETIDIGSLPVDCYVQYLNQSNRSLFEERINMYILASSRLEGRDSLNATDGGDTVMTDPSTNVNGTKSTDTDYTPVNETIPSTNNFFNRAFSSTTNIALELGSNSTANHTNRTDNYTFSDLVMETEEDALLYMTQCQKEKTTDIQTYLQLRNAQVSPTDDPMTFNWNRCWSKEMNDIWGPSRFAFFPTPELIEASRPAQQEATLENEFIRILNETEKACLDDGGEENECFELALEEASERAGDICHDNVEGTSWFFFSVMTTIGYGNQVPITDEGRLLIYTGGIACLILYAAVLGSAGYIILAIFDDFVARFWISHFLKYPLVGVGVWGGIWIGWAYGIAVGADNWWQERLPDFEVDRGDSLWFAFVSTSTIGLGDYFLQPEVMFASDALWFSSVFLIGFVFLSTFLNKIGGFLISVLPKRSNSLEHRLKGTNLFFWKHWPCIDYIQSDYLRSLAYDDDSEDTDKTLQHHLQQVQWVETLKSRFADQNLSPPLDDMHVEGETSMDDLLDEEEMILSALLDSVEQRRSEIHVRHRRRRSRDH